MPRPKGTTIVWAMCSVVVLVFTSIAITHDFRDEPRVGDSLPFLFQAVSLAHEGHNLSYDQADLDQYGALGWTSPPHGLFLQKYRHGWAFAKPYGYSLWLAPFLRVFGAHPGVAIANTLLLLGLFGVAVALLRLRYRGVVIPLFATSFVFGSYILFYAFAIYTDLFLAFWVAVVAYSALRAIRDHSFTWAALAVVLAAFLTAEKVTLLLAVLPLSALALIAQPGWRKRAALLVAGVVALSVFVFPYLFYSDFRTWNAYGGERYYAFSTPPFAEDGPPGRIGRSTADDFFSLNYVRTVALSNVTTLDKSPLSLMYYSIGRHTGLLTFMPLALVTGAVALSKLRRSDAAVWAILAGLGGYIVFYVVIFPFNYYGGGASLGNRYFLQISALIPALVAALSLRPSRLALAAGASALVAVLFLLPHYASPTDALRRIDRVSRLQRFLPFETNQTESHYFRCSSLGCPSR